MSKIPAKIAAIQKLQPYYNPDTDRNCPKELKCPLQKRLMRNPVIAADGVTYDEDSILNWFNVCNSIDRPIVSPKTGKALSVKTLKTNREHEVKIIDFLEQKLSSLHATQYSPPSGSSSSNSASSSNHHHSHSNDHEIMSIESLEKRYHLQSQNLGLSEAFIDPITGEPLIDTIILDINGYSHNNVVDIVTYLDEKKLLWKKQDGSLVRNFTLESVRDKMTGIILEIELLQLFLCHLYSLPQEQQSIVKVTLEHESNNNPRASDDLSFFDDCINYEIMEQATTASDGHTYEKNIFLDFVNGPSPITRETIEEFSVGNKHYHIALNDYHELALIKEYLLSGKPFFNVNSGPLHSAIQYMQGVLGTSGIPSTPLMTVKKYLFLSAFTIKVKSEQENIQTKTIEQDELYRIMLQESKRERKALLKEHPALKTLYPIVSHALYQNMLNKFRISIETLEEYCFYREVLHKLTVQEGKLNTLSCQQEHTELLNSICIVKQKATQQLYTLNKNHYAISHYVKLWKINENIKDYDDIRKKVETKGSLTISETIANISVIECSFPANRPPDRSTFWQRRFSTASKKSEQSIRPDTKR